MILITTEVIKSINGATIFGMTDNQDYICQREKKGDVEQSNWM